MIWKKVLPNDTKTTTFAITDAKSYVSVVTLSTQDNTKLLKQLDSGLLNVKQYIAKYIEIYWNKYLHKLTNQARNRYLEFLRSKWIN